VGLWQELKALKSPTGQLLTDVAELDDISGIILMALLFSVVPVLQKGGSASLLFLVSKEIGVMTLKLAAFGALCVFFSLYAEQKITQFCKDIESASNPMLLTVGTGFIIAALADLLGFSVAIGAFFAGLVFSRDPRAVKIDASFGALHEFFSPFFFIGVGILIDPGALTTSFGLGSILLVVAVISKVVGDGFPGWVLTGWTGGILLGVSMVPRAEIAMIIMKRGLSMGENAVPGGVFAAMVIVVAVSCIITPFAVRALLNQWQQQGEAP
jgi:Kef-type K+ transport system membrane component KefB